MFGKDDCKVWPRLSSRQIFCNTACRCTCGATVAVDMGWCAVTHDDASRYASERRGSATLCEAAKTAIKSHGWNNAMLNHMPLMDSSSARCTDYIQSSHVRSLNPSFKASTDLPCDTVNIERKLMNQAFTLSDGLILPRGIVFALPASSCARNVDLVASSNDSDPYRLPKLAQQDTDEVN
ncbi:hypothetical protein K491DRAFT_684345 [Lophiostoma macrostomum CBS 122681]|uniref:Uncharacterized protein n=1 Tax=Lophiostoma macrostomum CBS 122681 TaxID=1314788 RepID=A0A6A6SR41_9PLEO|nr:hypothetical protein K491DRAFT_684345 [Lophiostoma macrostomum CBS 122681]